MKRLHLLTILTFVLTLALVLDAWAERRAYWFVATAKSSQVDISRLLNGVAGTGEAPSDAGNPRYKRKVRILNKADRASYDFVYLLEWAGLGDLKSAGKVQSDCRDIYFTDLSGQKVPFFIKECSSMLRAYIKIRGRNNPLMQRDLWMFYGGNPTAGGGNILEVANSVVSMDTKIVSSNEYHSSSYCSNVYRYISYPSPSYDASRQQLIGYYGEITYISPTDAFNTYFYTLNDAYKLVNFGTLTDLVYRDPRNGLGIGTSSNFIILWHHCWSGTRTFSFRISNAKAALINTWPVYNNYQIYVSTDEWQVN